MNTYKSIFMALIISSWAYAGLSKADDMKLLILCENARGETFQVLQNNLNGIIDGYGDLKRTGPMIYHCSQGQEKALWLCTSEKRFYNYYVHAIISNPGSDGKVAAKIGFYRGGFRVLAQMTCSVYL